MATKQAVTTPAVPSSTPATGSNGTSGSTSPSGTPSTAPGSNAGTSGVAPATGFRESLLALQQGVTAVLPDGSSIPSTTGGYAKADILSQLAAWLSLYAAVDADRQQMKVDLQALKNTLPGAHAYYTSLKAALTGFFEPGNPVLAQFGFKPKKPKAKLSAVKLATAVIRSKQTRLIRGTKSKKQQAAGPKYTGPVNVGPVESTAQAAAPTVQPAAPAEAPSSGAIAVPTGSTQKQS